MNNYSDFTDLEMISKRWNELSEENTTKEENHRVKLTEDITKITQDNSSANNNRNSLDNEWNKDEIKPMITKPIGYNKENIKTAGRNPFPQIIDEDTENFRIKLDHLINIFKNDAISEFMSMKKFLLENQVKTIKCETEKYLNMYEEKSIQLEKTNEKLVEKINENVILSKRIDGLSNLCGKMKNKCKNQKILANYFNKISEFKKKKLLKKKFQSIAEKNYQKRILISCISNWKLNIQKIKLDKQKKDLTNKFNEESNEMMIKFNKENELLAKKLQETQRTLDEINISKEEMQENLKRAFMRGVCALNFEAMNILQEKKKNNEEDLILQTNGLTKKMLDINDNLNSLTINPLSEKNNESNAIESEANNSINIENEENTYNNKKIVFYQAPKMESKEHKWREAPVVGINNFNSKSDEYEKTPMISSNTESMKTIEKSYNETSNVLKEIENLPQKIKYNVYNSQEDEKAQGKVIIANVNKKKPSDVKKKTISTPNNIKKGKT